MPTDTDLESPYVPDDRFIAEVRGRVDRHRRRRRRAITSVATALLVVGGVGVWYADHRLSSVDRIEIGPTAADDPLATGAAFNLLVVGTDACGATAPDDKVCSPLRDETALADAIAVVRFDPSTNSMRILNVPRDLMLDPTQRVAYFGVPEIRRVLADQFGLTVDHAVVLTMDGLARIGDVLSLRLDVRQPARDRHTGLDLDVGCQELDGDELLALVRARHLEYRDDTGWKTDPTSDLGRMDRRAALLAAVLADLRRDGVDSLPTLSAVVAELERSGAVDDGLSNTELIALGRLALSAAHTEVATLPIATAPTVDPQVSGLGVLPGAALDELLARFGGQFTPAPELPTATLPATGEAEPPSWPAGNGGPAIGWADFNAC